MPSRQRQICGEGGVLDTIRSMLCFSCNDCHCWPKCFPPNWYYNTIADYFNVHDKHYGCPAMMRYFSFRWAESWMKCCCCGNNCCGMCGGILFLGIPIFCIMLLALAVFTAWDIFIGSMQILWGVLTIIPTFLMSLFTEADGLHPMMVSILSIIHGLVRICFPVHYIICCSYPQAIGKYIDQMGPTILKSRDWNSYVKLVRYCNIFSMRNFLMDKTDLDHILLRIPFINVVIGCIHLVIGLVGLIIGSLVTCFINTISISWIEWSGLHLMKGCLGISLVGVYIYDAVLSVPHHQKINYRFLQVFRDVFAEELHLQPGQNMTEQQISDAYGSSIYLTRTKQDYINFMNACGTQLNPYSLEWLFVENGTMNLMDWMACIPIAGFIPFIFRFCFGIFIWWTFGFWHTACRDRGVGVPSYFRFWAWTVCTGFFAGTVVFTWVNWIFFLRRKDLLPENVRTPTVNAINVVHNNYGTQTPAQTEPHMQAPPGYLVNDSNNVYIV